MEAYELGYQNGQRAMRRLLKRYPGTDDPNDPRVPKGCEDQAGYIRGYFAGAWAERDRVRGAP